jgi:hypothetical protein
LTEHMEGNGPIIFEARLAVFKMLGAFLLSTRVGSHDKQRRTALPALQTRQPGCGARSIGWGPVPRH